MSFFGPKMMGLRLARRWENRCIIRARVRNQNPWIREPSRSRKDGVDGNGDEEADDGPPLNTEFLMHNCAMLYEMLDSWGLRPKPNLERIQKEAGKPGSGVKIFCCLIMVG